MSVLISDGVDRHAMLMSIVPACLTHVCHLTKTQSVNMLLVAFPLLLPLSPSPYSYVETKRQNGTRLRALKIAHIELTRSHLWRRPVSRRSASSGVRTTPS